MEFISWKLSVDEEAAIKLFHNFGIKHKKGFVQETINEIIDEFGI